MNERNMLKKCYFGSKKFQAVYIFTMIVCMFSFCYYNAMNETNSILNIHTSTDWPKVRYAEIEKIIAGK